MVYNEYVFLLYYFKLFSKNKCTIRLKQKSYVFGLDKDENAMNSNLLKSSFPQVDAIIAQVLDAVNPFQGVVNQLVLKNETLTIGKQDYELGDYEHIYLVGFGKAVLPMALGCVSILPVEIDAGYLIAKHLNSSEINQLPSSIQVTQGSHPVPSEKTFKSTAGLVTFLKRVTKQDLVICLISGGGSALCSLPVEGVLPEDIQTITSEMLSCGAEINEINALRKHVDQIKGGGLAELVDAKNFVTLLLSDVIGSPLDVIASGPTVPDSSSFSDVAAIVEKYPLQDKLPARIMAVIEKGLHGEIKDTPKAGHPCFSRVQNQLIASNYTACLAAEQAAKQAGFNTLLLTTYLRGEAREAGRFLAGLLAELTASGNPIPRPACIILGGETTVTLRGNGSGGRNQEMALGAVQDMSGLENVLMVTLGTDGEDGPTDAAGAWVCGETLKESQAIGINPNEYLQNNDAYHYFKELNQLIVIGPTGTNVNDIALLFAF